MSELRRILTSLSYDGEIKKVKHDGMISVSHDRICNNQELEGVSDEKLINGIASIGSMYGLNVEEYHLEFDRNKKLTNSSRKKLEAYYHLIRGVFFLEA